MKYIKIYDNPESFDRYTVCIYNESKCKTGDIYGMSNNPLTYNGFNQYVGSMPCDYKSNMSHCGKKINQIPNDEIKRAIFGRLENGSNEVIKLK